MSTFDPSRSQTILVRRAVWTRRAGIRARQNRFSKTRKANPAQLHRPGPRQLRARAQARRDHRAGRAGRPAATLQFSGGRDLLRPARIWPGAGDAEFHRRSAQPPRCGEAGRREARAHLAPLHRTGQVARPDRCARRELRDHLSRGHAQIDRRSGPHLWRWGLHSIARQAYAGEALSPADPGVVLFTSGSFGAPRGVVLSQANLLANVATDRRPTYDLDPAWVLFNPLPIFHCFGLTARRAACRSWPGMKAFEYPSPLHVKQIPALCSRTAQASILLATDTFVKPVRPRRRARRYVGPASSWCAAPRGCVTRPTR